MKRAIWFGVVVMLGLATGCVERRMVINSEPPGALVYRNNNPLTTAPADDFFVYYGIYHYTLVKDGYETLQVYQKVSPPWYEWPGIDFVSEVLYPFKLRDVQYFTFQMQPLQSVSPEDVLMRGKELRVRAETITPLDPDGKPLPPSAGLPAGSSNPPPAPRDRGTVPPPAPVPAANILTPQPPSVSGTSANPRP